MSIWILAEALRRIPRNTFLLLFIIVSFFVSEAEGQNVALVTQNNVLLLNSYHQRMTWVKDITNAVDKVLVTPESGINLFVANMDTKRVNHDKYLECFARLLKQRFKKIPIRLLITSDDNAFDFAITKGRELWPDIPIVFCGVNNIDRLIASRPYNVAGVGEDVSALKTVRAMLRLHPDLERLFIINDYLNTGRLWHKEITQQLHALERPINIFHNSNVSFDELRQTVSTLPDRTGVLLGVYFADSGGSFSTYEQIGAELTSSSPVPVYCLLGFNLQKGVVGGDVISGYFQGENAAKIAMRVIEGENINSIPFVLKEANHFIFRHPQLMRWGINVEDLPRGSVILEEPASPFEAYKDYIVNFITVLCALTVLSLVLVVYIFRQKLKTQKHAGNDSLFTTTMQALPGMVYRCHNDGNWTKDFISGDLFALCGYRSGEFSGHNGVSFADLILKEDRKTLRETINRQLELTGSYEVTYRIQSRSGAIRWMWDRGTYAQGESNPKEHLVGFITDITHFKERLSEFELINKRLRGASSDGVDSPIASHRDDSDMKE